MFFVGSPRKSVRYSAFNTTLVFGENLLHHVRSRITSSAPFARARSPSSSSLSLPPPLSLSLSKAHIHAHAYRHTHATLYLSLSFSFSPVMWSSLLLDTCCFSLMQTRACKREAQHHVIGLVVLCICETVEYVYTGGQ